MNQLIVTSHARKTGALLNDPNSFMNSKVDNSSQGQSNRVSDDEGFCLLP